MQTYPIRQCDVWSFAQLAGFPGSIREWRDSNSSFCSSSQEKFHALFICPMAGWLQEEGLVLCFPQISGDSCSAHYPWRFTISPALQFKTCKSMNLNTFSTCDLSESWESVQPSCPFNSLPLYSLAIKNGVVGLVVLDDNPINPLGESLKVPLRWHF